VVLGPLTSPPHEYTALHQHGKRVGRPGAAGAMAGACVERTEAGYHLISSSGDGERQQRDIKLRVVCECVAVSGRTTASAMPLGVNASTGVIAGND
jgi:hypothetical protein